MEIDGLVVIEVPHRIPAPVSRPAERRTGNDCDVAPNYFPVAVYVCARGYHEHNWFAGLVVELERRVEDERAEAGDLIGLFIRAPGLMVMASPTLNPTIDATSISMVPAAALEWSQLSHGASNLPTAVLQIRDARRTEVGCC